MKATTWQDFRTQASQNPARIVLADGSDPRVVEAAALAQEKHIAAPILIGARSKIQPLWRQFSSSGDAPCVDPETLPNHDRERFVQELIKIAKFKSLTLTEARERVNDPLIFGCLFTRGGLADGFIGGATRTTGDTLRAVFPIIGLRAKTSTLFGFFLIERRSEDEMNPLVLLADCAVTPDPSAKQLANIALGAADAYEFFTKKKAKVAFLSFSTNGSAEHALIEKTRQAVKIAREKAPTVVIEGEWQADAALDGFSARIKGVGESPMAGQANVLIAPDLNCGNIAYKLVQRLGGCRSVGPILWGTALPANVLSRGCCSEDVLDMLALTTMQSKTTNREVSVHG